MLCSRCSEPFGPVVAIDIDGTLADYHSWFLRFASSWLGREPSHARRYEGSEPFNVWCRDAFKIDLTTFRGIKLAYRQGGLKRTMPMYEGADRLTAGARRAGAEVWLTTTRPHDRYDRVDPDTREWIGRNSVEFDGLLFGDDKYAELAARIDPQRVVAVLDDLTEGLMRAAELGMGPGVLRRTEWNAAMTWRRKVGDLDKALWFLRPAINQWKEQHE